jgi:hypothetical protein
LLHNNFVGSSFVQLLDNEQHKLYFQTQLSKSKTAPVQPLFLSVSGGIALIWIGCQYDLLMFVAQFHAL